MEIGGRVLDEAQRLAVRALGDPTGPCIYLWGPPGRGKTWLVDTYLAESSRKRVLRRHFHDFFVDVHREIRVRGSLNRALDALLAGIDVLCFDEFHVHDPADGQYVTALVQHVVDGRVRMIVTSNYQPSQLLPNPLFHSMFEPCIALIERHFRVVECDGGTDYRASGDAHRPGAWLTPGASSQLAKVGLRSPDPRDQVTLRLSGHPIVARRADSDEVWFDFGAMCATPTAPTDYLLLAQQFSRWVITDVPRLSDAGADAAQRFANLIDVLWEKRIEVVLTSSVPPAELAPHSGAHDIDRMVSRLSQLPTEILHESSFSTNRENPSPRPQIIRRERDGAASPAPAPTTHSPELREVPDESNTDHAPCRAHPVRTTWPG
ncbi:cell division protein ZapE [Gordonia sp. CPCC 205333]|uniref:cell division protein ZapE n=1 Tax=Gordonia sp. CPCC 205333 TaxID=3140790 RepID=UPI003AF369B1